MIRFTDPGKPTRIWIAQAWRDDENGAAVFWERAFKHKCEAEQFRRYCISHEGLEAEVHEVMLY